MGHDTTYGAVELVDRLAAGGAADDQSLPFPENSAGLARGAPLVGEVGEGGARPCEASKGVGQDATGEVVGHHPPLVQEDGPLAEGPGHHHL